MREDLDPYGDPYFDPATTAGDVALLLGERMAEFRFDPADAAGLEEEEDGLGEEEPPATPGGTVGAVRKLASCRASCDVILQECNVHGANRTHVCPRQMLYMGAAERA